MPSVKNYKSLFKRDLKRLAKNLETLPSHLLWKKADGVSNSCGVLVQHLVGNLRYFVNHGLGNIDYDRKRAQEFEPSNTTKEELLGEVEQLTDELETVFGDMDEQELTQDYPIDLPFDASRDEFLLHLYGHLNYHIGQLNYLRRILDQQY